MDQILTVSELTVGYGGPEAVRGVGLQVARGSVTGVLGANGAGKTSTLLGIHRAAPRISGSVVFDGHDLSRASTRDAVAAGLALCPQNRRLFANMSLEDNLRLGAYGAASSIVKARLDAAYERVPWIRKRHKEAAGRLSGGQQQAVAIERALMSAPSLLMLDEPSSGLSPVAVHEVRDTLRSVVSTGVSVLLVEQNVTLVKELCATAYVLANGRVAAEGSVEALVAVDALSDAYLG